MGISVTGNLVASLNDTLDDSRRPLRNPAEYEKSPFHPGLAKDIQNPVRIVIHPGWITSPVFPSDYIGKRFDMEIVLDVDS
jgi:hypothetical protein